jgi:peptidoglycan/LPS O-acetylase OafA/YrhL
MDDRASARITALDGLRGIAVLSVVLFHYTHRYGAYVPGAPAPVIDLALGKYGVHLFFIISGFVILMTAQRKRRLWDFATARATRLYPAYWIAVPLTAAVTALAGVAQLRSSPLEAGINLTMLQRFVGVDPVDGAYWSLAVELVFYGLVALALLAGLIDRVEMLALGWLALTTGLWAGWQTQILPTVGLVSTIVILNYARFFILGVVFYQIHAHGRSWPRVLLIVAALESQAVIGPASLTLLTVAACVVFALVLSSHDAVLRWRPIMFLGVISYPLYLIHQNIGYALIHAFEARGVPPSLAVSLAICFVIAAATLIAQVERPATRAMRARLRQIGDGQRIGANIEGRPTSTTTRPAQ